MRAVSGDGEETAASYSNYKKRRSVRVSKELYFDRMLNMTELWVASSTGAVITPYSWDKYCVWYHVRRRR